MPNLNDLKKQAQEEETPTFDPASGEMVPVALVEEKMSHSKPIAQSVWDEIVSAGNTVPNNMIF